MATDLRDLLTDDLQDGNWLHRLVEFGWGRALNVQDILPLLLDEPHTVRVGDAARKVFVRLEFSPFPEHLMRPDVPLLAGRCVHAQPVLGLDLQGNVAPAMCLAMAKMREKRPASWQRPIWAGPIPPGMAAEWKAQVAPGTLLVPLSDTSSLIYYPTQAQGYAAIRARLLGLGVTPDG